MKACICIPPLDGYPWQSARRGAEALGYEVEGGMGGHDSDILIVWSPWARTYRWQVERLFRKSGRLVIVMENGWLSPIADRAFFQVAVGGWNGTGKFQADGGSRWASWGIDKAPWSIAPGHVLVCGQRGHSYDERTAHPEWHERVEVPSLPGQAVIRRPRDATRPLAADLAGAAICHVWSSNAASWALLAGVPVVQHGPNLMVGALASRPGEKSIRPPRQAEFERLAWAQWTASEIETGEPFARLLEAA